MCIFEPKKGVKTQSLKIWSSDGDRRPVTAARCTATAGTRRQVTYSGPPPKRQRLWTTCGDRQRTCVGPPPKRQRLWTTGGDPPEKGGVSERTRFCAKIYHVLKIFSFYDEECHSPINRTSSFIKLELLFAT